MYDPLWYTRRECVPQPTLIPAKMIHVRAAAAARLTALGDKAEKEFQIYAARELANVEPIAAYRVEEQERYNSSWPVRFGFCKPKENISYEQHVKTLTESIQARLDAMNPREFHYSPSHIFACANAEGLKKMANLRIVDEDAIMYLSVETAEIVGYNDYLDSLKVN